MGACVGKDNNDKQQPQGNTTQSSASPPKTAPPKDDFRELNQRMATLLDKVRKAQAAQGIRFNNEQPQGHEVSGQGEPWMKTLHQRSEGIFLNVNKLVDLPPYGAGGWEQTQSFDPLFHGRVQVVYSGDSGAAQDTEYVFYYFPTVHSSIIWSSSLMPGNCLTIMIASLWLCSNR